MPMRPELESEREAATAPSSRYAARRLSLRPNGFQKKKNRKKSCKVSGSKNCSNDLPKASCTNKLELSVRIAYVQSQSLFHHFFKNCLLRLHLLAMWSVLLRCEQMSEK